MTEIQVDERTVKTLALNHYNKILVSTELLLEYADQYGLSIVEAIRDIMEKAKKLKADLEVKQG